MKSFSVHIIAAQLILLASCSTKRDNFLLPGNEQKIIAIQPLEPYDNARLVYLKNEIAHIFHREVILLKPVSASTASSPAGSKKALDADSILNRLQRLPGKEIGEVIAITHFPVYRLNRNKKKDKDMPIDAQAEYLMGLADFNGRCCIVSDCNFEILDESFF